MTEAQARKLGEQLIEVLQLKVKKRDPGKGRVDTTWGDKTPTGLGHVVHRIVEEHLKNDG